MSRSIARLISVVFLLVQMSQPVAQTLNTTPLPGLSDGNSVSGIDLDPPQVDHIPVVSGEAGAAQSLSVRAVDAQGIASVTLFYRSRADAEYKQTLMRPVYGTGNYTASIDSSADQKFVDYYFLVIDTGGNKVLNGFPYDPFTRALTAPQKAIEEVSEEPQLATVPEKSVDKEDNTRQVSGGQSVDNDENKKSNSTTILWAVLGVLAIGAIASASSGGGGDAPAESEDTVPVTLNVPLP